jgi:hypothetical protein
MAGALRFVLSLLAIQGTKERDHASGVGQTWWPASGVGRTWCHAAVTYPKRGNVLRGRPSHSRRRLGFLWGDKG